MKKLALLRPLATQTYFVRRLLLCRKDRFRYWPIQAVEAAYRGYFGRSIAKTEEDVALVIEGLKGELEITKCPGTGELRYRLKNA